MSNNDFEYKMSGQLVQTYLKMRKGKDKTADPQEYLCKIVNEEYGIKGTISRVVFYN